MHYVLLTSSCIDIVGMHVQYDIETEWNAFEIKKSVFRRNTIMKNIIYEEDGTI